MENTMESSTSTTSNPVLKSEDFSVDVKMDDKLSESIDLGTIDDVTCIDQLDDQKPEEDIEVDPKTTTDTVPVPVEIKCSVCHCRLVSLLCARDHYEGRRHQKNFMSAIKAKHEFFSALASNHRPVALSKLKKKQKGADDNSSMEATEIVSEAAATTDAANTSITDQAKSKAEIDVTMTDLSIAADKKLLSDELDGEYDGILMYCFVCDIQVNSNDQALQHYTGRKHKYRSSLVAALPKVSDSSDNNLKRKLQAQVSSEQQKGDGDSKPPAVKKSGGPKASPKPKTPVVQQIFTCAMCEVNVTSQDMLDAHLAGSKHRKILAKKNAPPVVPKLKNKQSSTGNGQATGKLGLTPIVTMTCNICSVAMNSQKQFEQHLLSGKHKSRLSSQSTPKNPGRFGTGNNGNNKSARKWQQKSYKNFVKSSTPTNHQQQTNWIRPQDTTPQPDQDWTTPPPPWPQQGVVPGNTPMPSVQDYHSTENYSFPYEPTRTSLGAQAQGRFGRPDVKPKGPNSYGQPPYMSYQEDNYHTL